MADQIPIAARAVKAADRGKIAYEQNAHLLFEIVHAFLPEKEVLDAVRSIAKKIVVAAKFNAFEKFSKLLCVRVAYDFLSETPGIQNPFSDLPSAATLPQSLPKKEFTDSFALFLRDRFGFSISEIAASIGTSEGSVRLKLERFRELLFRGSEELSVGDKLESHESLCVWTREEIEDSDLQELQSLDVSCGKCNGARELRLRGVQYFEAQKNYGGESEDLPEEVRKFPTKQLVRREGNRVRFNWSAAPWYFKILFEGFLASLLALVIVIAVPRAKRIYDFWLERRLDLYSVAELASGLTSGMTSEASREPESTSPPEPAPAAAAAGAGIEERLLIKPESEFSLREAEKPSPDKVYRILLKTDAPDSIKHQVLQLFARYNVDPGDEDGKVGIDLPGGIMFDVFIDLKDYRPIINTLAKLGDAKVIITRSKEKKVPGKAHFKIWLQRI